MLQISDTSYQIWLFFIDVMFLWQCYMMTRKTSHHRFVIQLCQVQSNLGTDHRHLIWAFGTNGPVGPLAPNRRLSHQNKLTCARLANASASLLSSRVGTVGYKRARNWPASAFSLSSLHLLTPYKTLETPRCSLLRPRISLWIQKCLPSLQKLRKPQLSDPSSADSHLTLRLGL